MLLDKAVQTSKKNGILTITTVLTTHKPQTNPRRKAHISLRIFRGLMASSSLRIKHGFPVALRDLRPSSPLFQQGTSLRITGKLQVYSVETAIAVIVDGDTSASLKIDTQNLRDISFRIGSIYQFIGELLIHPNGDALLQARVGRNVDGIDLNLYFQSLKLLQQFESQRRAKGSSA